VLHKPSKIYFVAYFSQTLEQFPKSPLTGVAKDANSTQDVVHLTLTKSGWLPSPFNEVRSYVAKIAETVSSPEVQLKFCSLQSRVHSSAARLLFFHGALAPRSGTFST